jgi:CDP-6-deoxy-D-xylo-4-hexulose-3-dehydrase
MTFKFPLATATWDQKEIDAMQNVIATGNFTMGKNVKSFEKFFSQYVGSQNAVMVNSGSSANLLMIAALFYTKNPKLKLKRGDEVIVPAVSWSTSYYPLYQYGLKIKFVDISLETLNYDLDQLGSAISKNTRVILAVNLLGNPNDFDCINKIIKEKKYYFIRR